MRLAPFAFPAIAALVGACSPPPPASEPTPPASTANLVTAPPASTPAAPSTSTRPARASASPSAGSPTASSSTGVRECDELYELCKACEPRLAPEIAAGNRVSCDAERARMTHFLTTSEGPGVPAACRTSLEALRPKCR